MMYNEFINRLPEGTRRPTNSEYEEIELVYASHPSISGSGHEGQEQIARLYSEFGMRIIRDMASRTSQDRAYRRKEQGRTTHERTQRIVNEIGQSAHRIQF